VDIAAAKLRTATRRRSPLYALGSAIRSPTSTQKDYQARARAG